MWKFCRWFFCRRFSFSGKNIFPRSVSAAGLFIALVISHGAGTAADKIRISYTSPGPQHGILWIADVSSLFKRNNLDVEIIYMPGNISAPSLMAGEVQFGQMTGALMAPVRLQGGDPVMLVSIQELLDDRLLARPNIPRGKNSKANALRSRALARPRTCACSICCRASV